MSLSDLICFDEIISASQNSSELIQDKRLLLTLCDHNALAACLEPEFGSAVIEIVDHHADRGLYPWVNNESASRIIAFADGKPTAMSACTLIAEAFLMNDQSVQYLTDEVATLLLAVIAVDSSNMSNATDRDTAMVTVRFS